MISLFRQGSAREGAGPTVGPVRPFPTTGPRPTVSVFVSSYNYTRFLPQCLTSVLTQDYEELDVLLIDDASADNSVTVAEVFASTDPRLRIIAHPRNRGHMETFNEGLAAARGEYFVKLDADDLLTPGSLARSVACAEHHRQVGFVYGSPIPFSSHPVPLARTMPSSWSVWRGGEWLARMCRDGYNSIAQPEVMIRTETIRCAGPYNPAVPHTSDMEMWMRLAVLADVATIDGADQGYYRIHSASMQHTIHKGVLHDLRGRRDAYESVLTGPGARLPQAGQFLDTARRTLATKALRHACDLADSRRAAADGTDGGDRLEDFVAFSLEVWPDSPRLAVWSTLEGLRRGDPRVVLRYRARTVARAAVRNAQARVRSSAG